MTRRIVISLTVLAAACAETPMQKEAPLLQPVPNDSTDMNDDIPFVDNTETETETDDTETETETEVEEPYQDGTAEYPFLIVPDGSCVSYQDGRDTSQAPSDQNDSYPPFPQDESGPEYYYTITLSETSTLQARLAFPEASGVDNDLHLLATTAPDSVIARDHYELSEILDPGTYYLVVDTYVSDGQEMSGPFELFVSAAPYQAGTVDHPIELARCSDGALELPLVFSDSQDTSLAESDVIDSYPSDGLNQSGPEYIYHFEVDQEVRLSAELVAPEPADTDIDLHLLDGIQPVSLITRGNASLHAVLPPGEYWLTADTYVSGGVEQMGEYQLTVQIRPNEIDAADYFNDYILDAVDYLYDNYSLLGYDSAALTHDIPYGDYGLIERSGGAKTMCVAAVLEVLLTAMELYEADTGDTSVWDFLPQRSWEYLGSRDLKAHLWVNHDLDSWGSADALRHFGMGENIPFRDLLPGSFINLNRTTGTGHAVIFLAFIDIEGVHYDTWNEDIVGFLYFSSQGGYDVGYGGLDYRYAVFSEYGSPSMPYKRDTNVIYRENDQRYLNTGMAFHPDLWQKTAYSEQASTSMRASDRQFSVFDPVYFDGVTIDD